MLKNRNKIANVRETFHSALEMLHIDGVSFETKYWRCENRDIFQDNSTVSI